MKSLMSVVAMTLLVSACSDKSKPNVEVIQDMMESPAVKAQEFDENSPDHRGMRIPPEGTVPVGFSPYKFAKNLEGMTANPNPLAGDMSSEVLLTGQKYYFTNCAVCHGPSGVGGEVMPVGAKLPLKPPSILSDKIRGWTDGQIYHVISQGQGVMRPYSSHIPQKYRWQVVNYIRHLQKSETK